MSSTFLEIVREITGVVPGYSEGLARRDVAKAYRDILDRRSWSFLIGEGGFTAPSVIQGGTVALTTTLPTITFNPTASALISVATNPPITSRQFRISTAGALYNILAYDPTSRVMTLDRPVLEPSAAFSSYMIYQCYFPPPPEALTAGGAYDFNRWISVVDPINGYSLRDDKGKAWLDRRDPQRGAVGLAYWWFDYKTDSHGTMLSEFWPHPTSGQEYVCLYKKRGLDFTSNSQPLPAMIPDSLVIDRALYHYAYRWASINAGRNPQLAKTNWAFLIRDAAERWKEDLQVAKIADENVSLTAIVGPTMRRSWPPADSSFLQGHSTGLEPFI